MKEAEEEPIKEIQGVVIDSVQGHVENKEEENKDTKQIDMKGITNRAKGSMMGALMGDAAGSILQFAKHVISDKVVELSLQFPGGGSLRMNPAQVTDDGELTLSLARGLLRGKSKLNQYQILKEYGVWFKSPPFDIGNTTYNALHKAANPYPTFVEDVIDHVAEVNYHSQSNGCLMRCTPIPIWGYRLSDEDVFKAGVADACLTHSHLLPQQVVGLYCVAIKHLINGYTRKETYEKVFQLALDKKLQILEWFTDIIDDNKTEEKIVVNYQIGWLKIAFCYAMHFLKNEVNYRDALKDILKRGGDTDTNACIIGGLLGAHCGVTGLPEDMWKAFTDPKKVETLRKKKRLLENQYIAQDHGEQLVEELLKIAPSELKIEIYE